MEEHEQEAPTLPLPPPQTAFRFTPILILLGLLAVLATLYFFVSRGTLDIAGLLGTKDGTKQGPVTLEYWGLFEPPEIMAELIEQYQKEHPDITINYSQKTFTNLDQYKTTLQTTTQQGTGPDIFRFHATWVPDLIPYSTPAPQDVLTVAEYEETFYPVAVENLIEQGQIYAIPLMYDGLALFYDPVRFEALGVGDPPETWVQFEEIAYKLTEYQGDQKKIKRSGAAIGVGSNIEHASDILGLMLAQNGVSYPDDLDTEKGESALTFYTNFVKEGRVWDATFPNSLQAFANGQVAMVFAPSWRVFDILTFNPRLNFKVAPVPQVPRFEDRYGRVGWANFWVEGVSKNCANPTAAWEFLKFLTSRQSQQALYAKQALHRPFGEFYSRRDLRDALMGHDKASAFLYDAENSLMWPITDASGNDENVAAVEVAIDSIFKSISETQAMKTLKAKLTGQSVEEY